METNKHMKSSAHFYFEMVLYLIHHERKKGCLVFLLENNIYPSDKKNVTYLRSTPFALHYPRNKFLLTWTYYSFYFVNV